VLSGDDIKRRRLELGLSQKEAADMCDKTQPWLAQIENLGSIGLSLHQQESVSPIMKSRKKRQTVSAIESCSVEWCENKRLVKKSNKRGAPFKYCERHKTKVLK
jgi:predicted transcriptional regulator